MLELQLLVSFHPKFQTSTNLDNEIAVVIECCVDTDCATVDYEERRTADSQTKAERGCWNRKI